MSNHYTYHAQTNLTSTELAACQAIVLRCHQYDHSAKDPYFSQQFNFFPTMPTFILAYLADQLIGFAVLYADSDPKDLEPVEVTLLVDPSFRHQGIGQSLRRQAEHLLTSIGYTKIYFVSELNFLKRQPTFLTKWQLKQTGQVEVQLSLNLKRFAHQSIKSIPSTVRPMKGTDIPTLIPAYCAIFNFTDHTVAMTYLTAAHQDVRCATYVLLNQDQVPIGYAALDLSQTNYYYLFSFFIAPGHRNQGLGSAFLNTLWSQLVGHHADIVKLAVEHDNQLARHLYHKVGFKEETQIVYLSTQSMH
ncbi:GNAT family N-acetyltransferase [Weissella halotolerans]|uniref:Acetyltransferasegnat family n=1 Tax=Weissella halotolerans DSM 20190 TaxID=1123500 RepID=A0A0R2FYI3_9LACO|nr:GNAT family N-acetyltransferase [Weissella halotolerans]KRN33491.1 acetyltransferasegnat family [Weissella halotolerans DSM 20190]